MKEQRRSSPQPPEEETPRLEACEGRPRVRELGDIAMGEVAKSSRRVRARGAAKVSKTTPERYTPVGVTTAEDIAKNYISRQAPPPPRSMLIDPSEI